MSLDHRIVLHIYAIDKIPMRSQGEGDKLILQFEGEIKRTTKDRIITAFQNEEVEIKQKRTVIG